ncbi:MAG TPA: DUF1284 domain-containing protein, partial [Myxococcota bacterium]|nr:DUF1284 domain-containing protein [Myxococcota bacterium]
MSDKIIAFRPHHFLCSLSYEGLGYSPAFVANYNDIAAQIRRDETTKLQVVLGLDDICRSCPHQRVKTNTCISQEAIKEIDDAHLSILGLEAWQ